jgi:sugar phosphate isomerase/epimerase
LSFVEDLRVYSEAGADGIGIDASIKAPLDRGAFERFSESGLETGLCVPPVTSVLPTPRIPGPEEPEARVAQMCRSVAELAKYRPHAFVCLTGPCGWRSQDRARKIVVDGLRVLARAVADVDARLAIEPIHASIADDWSLVTTLPAVAALLEDVGEPNVGIVFDVWHLWDAPDVLEHTRTHASRVYVTHVNDWREPTRGWCDRVLPGDGVADVVGILTALRHGGFEGWYELEIFSDDGLFGDDFPDSLWKMDPVELVRAGREQFTNAWRESSLAMVEEGSD